MTRKKKHDKHARLSCSGSERWIACPPSIAASEGIRRTSSASAEEGTMAHSVLEAALMLHLSIDDIMDYDRHEGVEVPEDMRRAVAHAVNYVNRWELEHPKGRVFIEEEVNPGALIDRDDLWGTSDLTLVDVPALSLEVCDYKHGKRKVEAKDNSQMRLYAVGALAQHFPKNLWAKVKVTTTILQPRVTKDGFDPTETITGAALLKWLKDIVTPAATASDDINGPRQSGDHCFFCPVSGTCRELTHKMFKVAAMEFGAVEEEQDPPAPDGLTPEEINFILQNANMLVRWLEQVEAVAQGLMLDGVEMDGFKLVYKAKHKKWDDKVLKTIERLKLPLDTYAPRDPLAVGKLLTQLKRDKAEPKIVTALSKLIITPDPEVAVASEEDTRREVDAADYGKFKEN